MTDYPEVTIEQLTFEEADQHTDGGTIVLLGDHRTHGVLKTSSHLAVHITKQRRSASAVYLLNWTGNKIPRGAVVSGHTIGWTQNDLVQDRDGNIIGTYERLVEFGGEDGKQQQMVVYLS